MSNHHNSSRASSSASRRGQRQRSYQRKKETAKRFAGEYHLETNDFGLNGQDFGLAELKEKHRRNSDNTNTSNKSNEHQAKRGNRPQQQQHHHELVANRETLEAFSDDVGSLWMGFGAIPVLEEPPSPLTFLRDYVSPSRPCIIRNAIMVQDSRRNITDRHRHDDKRGRNHLSLSMAAATVSDNSDDHFSDTTCTRPLHLSLDDIVDMDPTLEVVVDATPDGHGDCIRTVLTDDASGKKKCSRLFVFPEQRTMTLDEFRLQLREGRREQRRKESKHRHDNCSDNDDGEDGDDRDISTSHATSFGEEDHNHNGEEEEYDPSDGKRIFSLKKKPKKKKRRSGIEDFVYQSCTPTNGDTTPQLPGFNMMSCNPLDDMKDILMELVDNNDNKQNDLTEAPSPPTPTPPPPPPPPPPSVLYYSRQNDCFRSEMPSIYEATRHVIPESLGFAEEAFGTGKPEAVNLWMGDERAVSSMHKDPYENLFYVASGEKLFTLCPPSDAPYLYEKDFLSGSFDSDKPPERNSTKEEMKKSSMYSLLQNQQQGTKPIKRKWTVRMGFQEEEEEDDDASRNDSESTDDSEDDDIRLLNQNGNHPSHLDMEPILAEKKKKTKNKESSSPPPPPAYVRWIEADVTALNDPYYKRHQMRNFPLLKYTHPIHSVRVQAGELLYLPSLWFHCVRNSRETTGFNYWYNMRFDSPHWCYFQLLNQLQWKGTLQQQPRRRQQNSLADDEENGEDSGANESY